MYKYCSYHILDNECSLRNTSREGDHLFPPPRLPCQASYHTPTLTYTPVIEQRRKSTLLLLGVTEEVVSALKRFQREEMLKTDTPPPPKKFSLYNFAQGPEQGVEGKCFHWLQTPHQKQVKLENVEPHEETTSTSSRIPALDKCPGRTEVSRMKTSSVLCSQNHLKKKLINPKRQSPFTRLPCHTAFLHSPAQVPKAGSRP